MGNLEPAGLPLKCQGCHCVLSAWISSPLAASKALLVWLFVCKEQKEGRKAGAKKRERVRQEEKKKWAAVTIVIYRPPQTKKSSQHVCRSSAAQTKTREREKKTHFRVFASPMLSILSLDYLCAAISLGKILGITRKSVFQKWGHTFFQGSEQVLI